MASSGASGCAAALTEASGSVFIGDALRLELRLCAEDDREEAFDDIFLHTVHKAQKENSTRKVTPTIKYTLKVNTIRSPDVPKCFVTHQTVQNTGHTSPPSQDDGYASSKPIRYCHLRTSGEDTGSASSIGCPSTGRTGTRSGSGSFASRVLDGGDG